MINAGVVPLVPTRGSVGSSGDLAPLVHLFGVLLGSGFFYLATTPETIAAGPDFETHLDESGPDIDERQLPERVVLSTECLQRALSLAWEAAKERAAEDDPIRRTQTSPKLLTLSYKEGLALTNGATVSAALLALAVHDAETLASAADIALAMTAEAMCGCGRAFDDIDSRLRGERSRRARRQQAAGTSGRRARPLAIHGASRDTISYARMVIDQEIRAGIDNPIFFFEGLGVVTGDGRKWDTEFDANWPTQPTRDGGGEVAYAGHKKESFSAGNFHGQPVGLAADYLAIALAELANISERRTQLLLDRNHNRGLPGNLIPEAGVNSGYMLAQYCAAGLVSENKVLAHPASVDSIPTSANTEDHVAMATIACRKARSVLENVQAVIAIELMVAAQALDWRTLVGAVGPSDLEAWAADAWDAWVRECESKGRPTPAAAAKEKFIDNLATLAQPLFPFIEDRPGTAAELALDRVLRLRAQSKVVARLFERAVAECRDAGIAQLAPGTRAAYVAIREAQIETALTDRPFDEDIRRARQLVEQREGGLVEAVKWALASEHDRDQLRPIARLSYATEPSIL